ncbi:hypothetical protein XENORESO_000133 [Xenotaenia resolanae]|uniref:Uncharacterized protein n=1 Tax=Xenotaenia resolanae TaxID=208358 RepID=A0ABV0WDK7_9TELE
MNGWLSLFPLQPDRLKAFSTSVLLRLAICSNHASGRIIFALAGLQAGCRSLTRPVLDPTNVLAATVAHFFSLLLLFSPSVSPDASTLSFFPSEGVKHLTLHLQQTSSNLSLSFCGVFFLLCCL